MSARNRQHNDYPSITQRIERARELGIRSADDAEARSPYRYFGAGIPLFDAWVFGRSVAKRGDADEWIVAVHAYRPAVDLSAEMLDLCREVAATVPCGWPRMRRECAA